MIIVILNLTACQIVEKEWKFEHRPNEVLGYSDIYSLFHDAKQIADDSIPMIEVKTKNLEDEEQFFKE